LLASDRPSSTTNSSTLRASRYITDKITDEMPAHAEAQVTGRISVFGLALCKIHHAAYDRGILGVRSDLVVEVRADVSDRFDGSGQPATPPSARGLRVWKSMRLAQAGRSAMRAMTVEGWSRKAR
jgi:hypothetical protein